MYSQGCPKPPNEPIPLDPWFLSTQGREATEAELRRIVCSVKFELLEEENAVRLLGPEMSYHKVDPHLQQAFREFGPGLSPADILLYKSCEKCFDLCFEDLWTGYFIAKRFEERGPTDDLLLIHLDDHTDMMPTLLCEADEALFDPTSGAPFHPASSSDWVDAIYSGAVNIGNFITPFYYSGCNIHVRHINNSIECDELCYIRRDARRYGLIPGKKFAAIDKSVSDEDGSVGTYLAGSNPDKVLYGAPRLWTLVHIDLDYFINDFNGASRGEEYIPDPILRTQAQTKINRFFQSLAKLNPAVDRWLIATSPGFCSGYHWQWLLSNIESKIEEFEAAQVGSV